MDFVRSMKYFVLFWLFGLGFLLGFNYKLIFKNLEISQISKFFPQKQYHNSSARLLKLCQNYRVRERINPTYFYHYNNSFSGRGLLWCKVPKVGSTTLTKLFLRLAGVVAFTEDENGDIVATNSTNSTFQVHKILREKYPKLTLKNLLNILTLTSTTKFMVSRDPFERLVSAYRDKLEDKERDMRFRNGYYYENYGKFMLPAREFNSTRAPTWSEFISYLLKTSISRFDEHWMPMSRLCSPCATRYDFVVKLDHFQDQIQRPIKSAGIDAPNLGWSHRTGSGQRWIVNKYFNNLTLSDIKKLYVKYKRDFQLFGYKPYKYFKLGKSN